MTERYAIRMLLLYVYVQTANSFI